MINEGTILVVEDTLASLKLITDILTAAAYQVRPADSGELALASAEAMPPALILLDILMQGLDGFEVLRRLKAREETRDIPVILLSALTDVEKRVEGLKLGAADFISKPFQADELLARVRIHLELFRSRVRLEQQAAALERNLRGSIRVISETIERKGPFSPGHHQRVAALASAIAREIRMTDFQVEGMELAAAVYDIGMINVPIEILQDPGRLGGAKLALYQSYPQDGHDALRGLEFPWPIADIILQHRECFDGSGFPRGIQGDSILREARVMAIAHAVEDLTTNKSYRSALPIDGALEEISSHSGSRYDPLVVAACLTLFREKGFTFK